MHGEVISIVGLAGSQLFSGIEAERQKTMFANENESEGDESVNKAKTGINAANGDATAVDENVRYLDELMRDMRVLTTRMGTSQPVCNLVPAFGGGSSTFATGLVESLSVNASSTANNALQLRHAHLLLSAEIDRVWQLVYSSSGNRLSSSKSNPIEYGISPNNDSPSSGRALFNLSGGSSADPSSPENRERGLSFLDRKSSSKTPPPLVFDPMSPPRAQIQQLLSTPKSQGHSRAAFSPTDADVYGVPLPIGSPHQQHFISFSPRQYFPRYNLANDGYFYRNQFSLNEPHAIYTTQDKIYLPHEPAHHGGRRTNYIGRILGPCGITVKQLEAETDCLILIRGKGSVKDPHRENRLRGLPGWEHLDDRLHVIVRATDHIKERCEQKLTAASEKIRSLLTPEHDEHKRRQLIQLAIINGTYRQEHFEQKQGKEAKTSHRVRNSNREADSKMTAEGSQRDDKETEEEGAEMERRKTEEEEKHNNEADKSTAQTGKED